MTLHVKKGTDWKSVYAQARSLAPEAFETDRINNLIMGEWASVGTPSTHVNPVDQMPIEGPPKIDHQTAIDAVAAAARQHKSWGLVNLDERKARVSAGLVGLREARDTSPCYWSGRLANHGDWRAPMSTAASMEWNGT